MEECDGYGDPRSIVLNKMTVLGTCVKAQDNYLR